MFMGTDLTNPASASEEVGAWADDRFVDTVDIIPTEDAKI
jgi:hypothetical protein